MANPNDPKPTNPNDPNAADKAAKDKATGQSSYDFNFDEVQSYSDLPPVPQPEANDGPVSQAALPPRPSVRRPTQGSFDFIDLDADMAAMSDPDVQLPPVPPLLTPTPNAVELPPAAPLLVPTPNAVDLPPVPAPGDATEVLKPTEGVIAIPPAPAHPVASTDIVIELPSVPSILTPTPNPTDLPSAPGSAADISTLYPPAAQPTAADSEVDLGEDLPMADEDSGSFVMAGTPSAPVVPSNVPMPTEGAIELPPMAPVAFTMSAPDIDLGKTESSAQVPAVTPTPAAEAPPLIIPTPNPAVLPQLPGSAADVSTLYASADAPTAAASSDADLGILPTADADGSGSFVMAGTPSAPVVPSGVPLPTEGSIELPPSIPIAFTASAPDIDIDGPTEPPSAARPVVTPTPNVADLPPVLIPTPNPTNLPQMPGSAPDVSTLFKPATPPRAAVDVPTAAAASDADLGELTAAGDGSFVMTGPTAAPSVPSAIPAPSEGAVNLPPTIPVAFTMSASEIDLGAEPPSGEVPLAATAASFPDIDLTSLSGTNLGEVPDAVSASLPDFDLDMPTEQIPPVPEGIAVSFADLDLGEMPPLPAIPDATFTTTSADLDLSAPPPLDVPSGSFCASVTDIDLGDLPPDVPSGSVVATAADLDLSSDDRTPAVPEGVATTLASVDLPDSGESQTIPMAFAASSGDFQLPPVEVPQPVSGVNLGSLPLPTGGEPSSATMNIADLGKLPPVAAGEPSSATLNVADLVPKDSADILDISALAEPAVEPASDVADIGSVQPSSDDQPSSFKMGRSVPELPPIRMPSEPGFQLPPIGLPGTDPSLASMGSSGTFGSMPSIPPVPGSMGAASVPDISILFPEPPKVEAPRPPFPAPDDALGELDLPIVPPDATASTVGLGAFKPVVASDSWLTSGAYDLKRTDPDVVPPQAVAGAPAAPAAPDSSDIFSDRKRPAVPPGAEHSDVIIATAYPAAPTPPDAPARPSDVAITFDGPPGGSTIADADDAELPLAEAGGSSAVLNSRTDDESIHDAAGIEDPLFDSATLADAPDLPPARPVDATDFGALPVYTPDASSILGGTETNIDLDGGSAVSIERPGMGGTLGAPSDGGFDLTVPDQPIPAGLFDDEPEMPPSGSDLFESRTSAEFDLDDLGKVEPIDDELVSDQPSLTSAPSSIFSGGKTPAAPGASEGGAISMEPTDPDIEEAEFNPQPADIRRSSAGDFQLPDMPDEGEIDWDVVSENEDATRGMPRDASLSALVREQMEEANDNPTRDEMPVPSGTSTSSGPEVTVDWMTGSSEQAPALADVAPVAPPKKPAKPGKKPAAAPKSDPDFNERPTKTTPKVDPKKPKALAATDSGTAEPAASSDDKKRSRETRSLFTGVLLGGLLASGLAAGAYIAGLGPNSEKVPVVENKDKTGKDPNGTTVVPIVNPLALVSLGDPNAALKALPADPKTPEDKANVGAAQAFARIQALGKVVDGDAELNKARDTLRAAIADTPTTPDGEKTAALAASRLGATYSAAGNLAEARKVYQTAKDKYKDHAAYFDALLDMLDSMDAKAGGDPGVFAPRRLTPAEAERLLLELTVLLREPKADPEPEEAGVYYWKAMKAAKEGKYPEATKLIEQAKAAHTKRATALAGRGLNPLTDPLEQMFPRACDEMIKGWDARAKYEGTTKELMTAKADLTKVNKDLTDAKADYTKAAEDLKTAKADFAEADKGLKAAKLDLEKLDKDFKALDKDHKALVTAKGEVDDKLKVADKDLKAAQDDAKAKGDTLAKVATELKPVKPLPADAKPDELLAVVKTAAGLASGVDAKRVVKAETEAKDAKDKLDAETKAFKLKYDTDTMKLKTDAAADLKKAEDGYAVELKKQKDAHDKAVTDLSAAADKALKAEQARTAAEQQKAAEQAVSFQKQLASAITPSQGLDLWLPVLAELRRPADANPAMAVAARALASSTTGSEDEGKARTTTGMGLLLKADYANAKTQFQLAVRGAGYAAAKEKGAFWTKVAENGLEATDDPVALYRLPPTLPPVDARTAAGSLDAGVRAYKGGRYDDAVTALTAAVKSDPSDPVTWYFLGAARYAKGEVSQAEKDIAQGSEREQKSPVPGRTVSAALAPIQGRVRGMIDKVRP